MLEVCHVVAYTTVKLKQMVGFYLPCPLLRIYYTIYVFYVSFYKNKNNLYKYEAKLVIFVSNSKKSGLGDALIYRDKLSVCWQENDSFNVSSFLGRKKEKALCKLGEKRLHVHWRLSLVFCKLAQSVSTHAAYYPALLVFLILSQSSAELYWGKLV